MDSKGALLREWARYLVDAARRGGLGPPIAVQRVEAVAGPRAGALEVYAGLDAGRLLRVLTQDDAAVLRQFIPWSFTGQPAAFMVGRFVRLEAGWPETLAETMIRLGDLGRYPRGEGRWVVGRNEYGQTVVAGLDDRRAHYLVGGATGSGKSVALQSAILQLAADPDNRLVLLDGKYGHGLREVAGLPGVVGPLAVDGESARAALGWVCAEMRRRYEAGQHQGRVVVIFDEFQEFVADPAVAGLMKRITAQGRAAGVHLIAATHHPTVGAFGDPETRRNLTGRIALLVGDAEASRVVIGASTPRADFLHGCGDAYALSPGVVNRVQVAYVDGREFARMPADGRGRLFDEWPPFEAEVMGREPEQVNWSYSDVELAIGLISASQTPPEGRDKQATRLGEHGVRMGSPRAARLIKMCQGTVGRLDEFGYSLLPTGG